MKPENPRVGIRMLAILRFVRDHPGITKLHAVTGAHCPSITRGYESVNRLIDAGLVDPGLAHYRSSHYRLRITDAGRELLSEIGE